MKNIFSKIIDREIPSEILYEQENLIVIKDINPEEKTHLLIIPKKVIESIDSLEEGDKEILADMFFVAKKIAKELWISWAYKLKINVWEKWGQTINHLHLHLLSKY